LLPSDLAQGKLSQVEGQEHFSPAILGLGRLCLFSALRGEKVNNAKKKSTSAVKLRYWVMIWGVVA
jgi:hypothetical protein